MSRSPISRRGLIGSALGAGALGLIPPPARASVSAADRKFIFVFACGGWDPTRVFADGFDNPLVNMENGAERASAAGLPYIDYPDRPAVGDFFERYASQTAVIQGMLVPSIAHEACFILSMTGSFSDSGSDWAAILGAAGGTDYVAPTLVLGGPSFPGENLPSVVLSGSSGQLTTVAAGTTTWASDNGLDFSVPARQRLDAYMARRVAAFGAGGAGSVQVRDYVSAHRQAEGIKGLRHQLSLSNISSLSDASNIAVQALQLGMSRTVMLCSPVTGLRDWDSHTSNDDLQNVMFTDLFENLLSLMFLLEATPGRVAPTLAEETTVLVFSEMGRTPWRNNAGGKDHWPHTSAMLVGSGIRGGVTVGGWDADWQGKPIDPGTGETTDSGVSLGCASLGATLLALGDVDPEPWVGSAPPLTAVIA
jgi:hypothetical protein